MERTKRNAKAACYAACVLFLTVACIGCGHPMMYHFKHYQVPFSGIAESNKTYFHSSHTGRIIPKDECATYCEPGCFGYEPTCWTRWPSECPGNCPVQGEVISDVPATGVTSEGSEISEVKPYAADRLQEPLSPVPLEVESAPAIQVPSIPADVESSVPSPSDATKRLRSELTTQPEPKVAAAEVEGQIERQESTMTRTDSESNAIIARKVIPPKKTPKQVEFKPLAIDIPQGEKTKTELALEPIKLEAKPTALVAEPNLLKGTSPIATKAVSTAELPKDKRAKPEKVTATVTTKKQTAKVAESVAVPPKPVKEQAKAAKRDKETAVIKVSDPGNSSQLRFATQPTRKPNRMSTVADQRTLIRFR